MTVVDDRLGKTIYADNIKLVKGVTRKTPSTSLERAGMQLLTIDRNDLYTQLRLMGSDNIITPVEKKALDREWTSLNSSLSATIQKINEYGISEDADTLSLYQSYDDLKAFIDVVLDPTTLDSNSDITNLGSIKDLFKTYYDKKTLMDERIFRLETGMLNGLDYRTKFTVNVISSTGITIPVDGTSSTIHVALYQEGVDVTDNYLDSEFIWARVSEDRIADAAWRDPQQLVGKSIIVTKDDLVNKSASFSCTFKHLYSDTMYFEKVGFSTLSEEVPGKDGENAISVQIFSNNGNIFRSGQCYTTMTVTVWRGDENITDQLDPSLFRWERTSNDPVADEAWNTSSKAIGQKTLELSPADVFGRAVFACHVEI